MADTAPMPPVGPGGAGDGAPRPAGRWEIRLSRAAAPVPRGRGLRMAEAVAGLLSGGLLVLGLGLLVLQFLAPLIAPGTGLSAATGPGWARVAMQLGAGLGGECAVLARRFAPTPVRWVLAPAVIVVTVAVLWFAWWA